MIKYNLYIGIGPSPNIKTLELPMPWRLGFNFEYDLYKAAFISKQKTVDEVYDRYHSKTFGDWKTRINKAAFYGGFSKSRELIVDASILRPDLIDVGIVGG